MGIRIHKVLGYALTDVKTVNFEIVDPRFDLTRFNYIDDETEEDFLSYVNEKVPKCIDKTLFLQIMEENKNWSIRRSIYFDPEFGMNNVICFVPPDQCEQWVRYDDTIDYYQESGIIQNPKIKHLRHGIYPYNSLYMYTNSGERVDSRKVHLCYDIIRNKLKKSKECDILFEQMGFRNKSWFLKNINTVIPPSLTWFVEWLGIFKNTETILRLKPVLYTFWS